MLDFRPICLEDRAWIEPVMQAAAGHGSEFSFVNLYLWGDQRVASVDGTPVFLSNFSGSLTYPWPVGCRDLPGTLELLRQDACERGIPLRLFGLLPEELRESYRPLLHESDPGVARIVKAADKLSAYIKCVEELKAGNREFEAAARQTREALTEMHLPCLDYFIAHFLDAFQLTLDELD